MGATKPWVGGKVQPQRQGAEGQELGHPAAGRRFPEPRLTSTGQPDHHSPAHLLRTQEPVSPRANRNRALSPPNPARCHQSSTRKI